MFYLDPLYIILSLPAILLGVISQILVRYFYSKYSRVPNSANISGVEIVKEAARKYGLNVRLNISIGDLTDHYDPFRRELTLSERVASAPSIASVGIAAHEVGHVLQHKFGGLLLGLRNLLVPIVNLGTSIGFILFIIGISINFFGLVILGIVLFSVSTLFTIITLPIEIDASRKAQKLIKDLNIFDTREIKDVNKVLIAAALTYVAAAMQSLASLVYYILRAFGVRRRD